MATFYYSNRAEEDLYDIVLYIAIDNLAAAERVDAAIEKTAQLLVDNPAVGRTVPSSLPDLMMFPVRDYRQYLLFYQQQGNDIVIQRILHGARDIPSLINT